MLGDTLDINAAGEGPLPVLRAGPRASASSAPGWRPSPPCRSPSSSPAASWTRPRRRRCCSTTRSRTPRTAPGSSPTGRTPSRCAPCSPASSRPGESVRAGRPHRDVIEAAADVREILSTVVPPDLHDQPGVDSLLAGEHTGSRETWSLISERLVFATVMEFGLRSRQGRTLELTRSVAVEVALDDPARATAICRDVQLTGPGQLVRRTAGRRSATSPSCAGCWSGCAPAARSTTSGWRRTCKRGGTRWQVWGGRPAGMPAFPRGLSAPAFLLATPEVPLRVRRDHRARQLVPGLDRPLPGLDPGEAADYLARLLPALAADGIVAAGDTEDGNTGVRAACPATCASPGSTTPRPSPPGSAATPATGSRPNTRTGSPTGPASRAGSTAARAGSRPAVDDTAPDDYYRRLYLDGRVFRVVTGEHTGMLTRAQRETVGEAVPRRASATPTRTCSPARRRWRWASTSAPSRRWCWRRCRTARPTTCSGPAAPAGRAATPSSLTLVGRTRAGPLLPDRPARHDRRADRAARLFPLRRGDPAPAVPRPPDRPAPRATGCPGVLPMPRRAHVLFGPSGWLTNLAEAGTPRRRPAGRGVPRPLRRQGARRPPPTSCASSRSTASAHRVKEAERGVGGPPGRPAAPPAGDRHGARHPGPERPGPRPRDSGC